MTSQATASEQPRPTAGPLIAAMRGTGNLSISKMICRASAIFWPRHRRFSTSSGHPSRSPPAQKTPPVPVRMTARTQSKAAMSAHTVHSLVCIALSMALARPGRSMRMTRIPSGSASMMIPGGASIGVVLGESMSLRLAHGHACPGGFSQAKRPPSLGLPGADLFLRLGRHELWCPQDVRPNTYLHAPDPRRPPDRCLDFLADRCRVYAHWVVEQEDDTCVTVVVHLDRAHHAEVGQAQLRPVEATARIKDRAQDTGYLVGDRGCRLLHASVLRPSPSRPEVRVGSPAALVGAADRPPIPGQVS